MGPLITWDTADFLLGFCLGSSVATMLANPDWKLNARRLLKRRRRLGPYKTPIGIIMERPEHAAFVRDLNKREPP